MAVSIAEIRSEANRGPKLRQAHGAIDQVGWQRLTKNTQAREVGSLVGLKCGASLLLVTCGSARRMTFQHSRSLTGATATPIDIVAAT